MHTFSILHDRAFKSIRLRCKCLYVSVYVSFLALHGCLHIGAYLLLLFGCSLRVSCDRVELAQQWTHYLPHENQLQETTPQELIQAKKGNSTWLHMFVMPLKILKTSPSQSGELITMIPYIQSNHLSLDKGERISRCSRALTGNDLANKGAYANGTVKIPSINASSNLSAKRMAISLLTIEYFAHGRQQR